MFINTIVNPSSDFFSSSSNSNSIVRRLADAVSGGVKPSLQLLKTGTVFSPLQEDEFISSTSSSDSSNDTTALTYDNLQLKRKPNLENCSTQTSEAVADDNSFPVQSVLIEGVSTEPSHSGYNIVDRFIEKNNSEIRYNDFTRFVADKTAELIAKGEKVSFELPAFGKSLFKSLLLLKGLEAEKLALDKYGKPKIPDVTSKTSVANDAKEQVKNEEQLPRILVSDVAMSSEQAESLALFMKNRTNTGECNANYDTTDFDKWQQDYYDYLESSGKAFYSEISQAEEQAKFGDKVESFIGTGFITNNYTVGIVSYGKGEISQSTPDNFKSNIISPIMDKLAANGITLDNKEGFTVAIDSDGTITLGDHNIKDKTKAAEIEQAIAGDDTLGIQLINMIRNGVPFRISGDIK
jgi:hypothetical protein